MKKWLIALQIGIPALVICVLGGLLGSANTPLDENASAMVDMWHSVSRFAVPHSAEEHGADYEIQWEDAAMEAHIRFLLDRPEGAIYHKDVWDIHVLCLMPGFGHPQDIVLRTPPDGSDTYTYESVFELNQNWKRYNGKTFEKVHTLADLRHFDGLQILYLLFPEAEANSLNLAGLEQCRQLQVLQLRNLQLSALDTISQMKNLENLALDHCGTIDLEKLGAGLPLSVLSLREDKILSLEPLTNMTELRYLNISDIECPDLEPLAQTSIRYLSMGGIRCSTPEGTDLDLRPLARIPGLVALSLSGLPQAEEALCREILTECKNLKYLDIMETPAASAAENLPTDQLEVFAVKLG